MNFVWVLVPVFGYVLGMFQSAEVVGRFVGRDPRREGSRNPGASNMYRLAGRNAAGIVLALDVLKGMIAAATGLLVDGPQLGLAAGAAAIVGHVFPAIRRLRGGKGVATFGGVVAVLFTIPAAVGLACWAVALRVFRRASLASLAGVIGTTAAIAAVDRNWWAVVGVGAVGLLIVIRHWSNLSRLLRGEETPVA